MRFFQLLCISLEQQVLETVSETNQDLQVISLSNANTQRVIESHKYLRRETTQLLETTTCTKEENDWQLVGLCLAYSGDLSKFMS